MAQAKIWKNAWGMIITAVLLGMGFNMMLSGCSGEGRLDESKNISDDGMILPEDKIIELESGLSAVKYEGDTGFGDFLAAGGASADSDVAAFLTNRISGFGGISFGGNFFGCSTISARDSAGNSLFGRNFDWNHCDALIVKCVPEDGYASISTVNLSFISGIPLSFLSDETQALIACYAPLDGMNEKGLCVSVNMISDSATIDQDSDKPDVTTTTAIRLLLDYAADVDEAINLLESYDLHASMGYMVHFAIADGNGKSVCVEYINNEMVVTETQVVTNFYLAEGERHGIGTAQSHERYAVLTELLDSKSEYSMEDIRDALDSVSKDNFDGFESTEWSIVFNQASGEARYYHRENYEKYFAFSVIPDGINDEEAGGVG